MAMCILCVTWACAVLRAAETRRRFLLTLALTSQIIANKLRGPFHHGVRQTAMGFFVYIWLYILAALLMWVDMDKNIQSKYLFMCFVGTD